MSDSPSGVVPPLAGHGHLALDEVELTAWGERFGRAASAPLVVGLTGELGAGKTTLARAICRGYGVTDDVTSPTFTLVHRYAAPRSPVYHVDLYRLRGPQDLTNIGWDDMLAEDALVLIEWGEKFKSIQKKATGEIAIVSTGGDARKITGWRANDRSRPLSGRL